MTHKRLPCIAAVALAFALVSCGGANSGSGIDLSSDQVNAIYQNAVNNNGWTDVSADTWADLAVDACDRGAWDHDTNATIVSEFLTANGWVDRAEADQMPLIIWLNLHIACPDLVPDDATPPPGALG